MIGFEDFADDVIQKTTSRGVPMRPVNEMGVIKHDARDGSLKILLPSGENDEPREAEMDSLEFVVITQIQHLKGSSLISNPSFQEVFDLYETGKKGSRSIGLMTWQDTRESTDEYFEESKAFTNKRLVGLLRAVDGDSPADNEAIKEVFGDGPVPVFFDVYSKKQEVLNTVWPSGKYSGVAISMKADKSKATKYTSTYWDRGQQKTAINHKPVLAAKKLEKANLATMAKYAQDYLTQVSNWLTHIKKNDRFLNDLYKAGFRAPDTVNKLRTYGVGWDTWEDKLKEWQQKGLDPQFEVSHMLAGDEPTSQLEAGAPREEAKAAAQTAEKPTTQSTENPAKQPADASATPAPKQAPVGDTEITDEDLPF